MTLKKRGLGGGVYSYRFGNEFYRCVTLLRALQGGDRVGKGVEGYSTRQVLPLHEGGTLRKDGVNTWDYSGKRATESVYESMERLHIDYIDLINVHDIEFADLNQVVNETLPALVELREKGW